jgi:membrane protease subunit (stomatin/prohibitin family)
MGILKNQLRSVIDWNNSTAATLFERWSQHGDEIKNASKLIVGPGQGCLFVYEGRVQGVHVQEGMFDLRTANLPFVTTLLRVMQGFVSEHKVGLYFFRTAKILNLKWGTPSLIKYEDPRYKLPVGLRAFGNYSTRITDPAAFFVNVVAGKTPFLIDDIREPINARIEQPLTDYLAESKLSYTEIDANREEIAAGLSTKLASEFSRLGFVLEDFRIQGTSFDEDTMRRINRIADISAETQAANSAGLSYAELQRLAALRDAAKNQGAAGVGMAMAVGMNMAGAASSATPPGASEAAAHDPAVVLQRLKALLDQGLISHEDFEAKKKEVLARL